jgi:nitrogen-specific signal transduction histidine kinase
MTGSAAIPFYTTKSGGRGIGLSVSRSIIDSHHERLRDLSTSTCDRIFLTLTSAFLELYLRGGSRAAGI